MTAPPAGKGQVVFYRRSWITGAWTSYPIVEGAQDVGKLKNGSYFVLAADPGPHTFVLHSMGSPQITIQVEAGQTYYVQQFIMLASAPVATYRWYLTPGSETGFNGSKLKLATAKPEG